MCIEVCLFAHSRFGFYIFHLFVTFFIRVFIFLFSKKRDISFVFIIDELFYSNRIHTILISVFL